MSLEFRPAIATDVPAIVDLLADDPLGQTREKPETPVDSRYRQAFEAIDRDPNQLLVVCERDGLLAGCMQLSFIPGLSRIGLWRGQIESVRIAAGNRNAGLGRQMFEWAVDTCRQRGCGLVQLTTDKARPDALRFYESLGFSASHEGLKLTL